MIFKKIVVVLNILLVCTMVIHVGVQMFLHSQHPEYSAPIYVELIYVIYYLIPLVIINAIKFFIN